MSGETASEEDYTWQITIVNVFLLLVSAMVLDGINGRYFFLDLKNPFLTTVGVAVVYLFLAGVVASVLYLLTQDKKSFRTRRCLVLSAWFFVFIMTYGVISNKSEALAIPSKCAAVWDFAYGATDSQNQKTLNALAEQVNSEIIRTGSTPRPLYVESNNQSTPLTALTSQLQWETERPFEPYIVYGVPMNAPYNDPWQAAKVAQEACIQTCRNASYLSRHLGDCSPK